MKYVLLTGATSGIGKAAAFGLAKAGHHLTYIARDRYKAEVLRHELIDVTKNKKINILYADFNNLKQVKEAALQYYKKFSKLHILINNAGLINTTRKETDEGYEQTFQVNHLAPFLLTTTLLDLVQQSTPAKIIITASHAHHRGHIDFDDLMGENYNPFRAYAQSKLANVLFTFELAHRLKTKDIKINAFHPGVVNTQIWRDGSGIWGTLKQSVMPAAKPFLKSPKEGAETLLYLALEENTTTARYFSDKKIDEPSKEAKNPIIGKRLWDVSEELIRGALDGS